MNTSGIDPLLIAWRRAWHAPTPPDVQAFLTTHPQAPLSIVAQICALDLRMRYASGAPRPVESYWTVHPPLADDEAAVVELAYAEYRAQVELGTPPALTDYVQRFPDYAPAIVRQIQVDQLFDADEDATRTCVDRAHFATLTGDVPARLGRYVVLGRLDGGGQADVFRAVHPELRTEVVIKWSRPGSQTGETLRSEGQLLARLEHSHLARVYDLDTADGRPFVVMESIVGQNLRQLRTSRTVTFAEAVMWVAAVARAADYAHRLGITHRDIKPANIVIDAQGQARLIDFGLAQNWSGQADNTFDTGRISGTATFMAPEQAQGQTVGPAADIFALGGVLYFLLTGRPPFAAETVAESLTLAARGEWERGPLAAVPPRLAAVCTQALAADPNARYSSAIAFAQALEASIRPRRYALTAALVVGMGLLAGGLWCWPTATNMPAVAPPTVPVVSAELSVSAWVGERYVPLPAPAPLRTGQRVRFTAEVPARYHVALFAFAADGLTPLSTYEATPEPQTIRYPRADQKASKLAPPGGTQVIVLVGSTAGPIDSATVRARWSAPEAWPALPEMSVLHLRGSTVRVLQQSRTVGAEVEQDDPEGVVSAHLRSVGQRLLGQYSLVEAIAFRQVE